MFQSPDLNYGITTHNSIMIRRSKEQGDQFTSASFYVLQKQPLEVFFKKRYS